MINENHVMIQKLGLAFDWKEMDKVGKKTYQNENFKIRFIQETPKEPGNLPSSEDARVAFKEDIRAKMRFLADKIAEPAATVDTLYQVIEMNQKLSKMLANINPTHFMRSVLKQKELIAKAITSDYIMVWPCREVISQSSDME